VSTGRFSDLLGTLKNAFKVGKASIDASGVATARTITLADAVGGTVPTVGATAPVSPFTGQVWIPSTQPGSATVTVDFGTSGEYVKTFDVTVTGAVTTQRVLAAPSLSMPAGVAQDELEMDPLNCSAVVQAADTVRLIIASVSGARVSGQRNINLFFD
jgi:hypothetical protein